MTSVLVSAIVSTVEPIVIVQRLANGQYEHN